MLFILALALLAPSHDTLSVSDTLPGAVQAYASCVSPSVSTPRSTPPKDRDSTLRWIAPFPSARHSSRAFVALTVEYPKNHRLPTPFLYLVTPPDSGAWGPDKRHGSMEWLMDTTSLEPGHGIPLSSVRFTVDSLVHVTLAPTFTQKYSVRSLACSGDIYAIALSPSTEVARIFSRSHTLTLEWPQRPVHLVRESPR